MRKHIYLDDMRTPVDNFWTVVRSFDEFKKVVEETGLSDIEVISLDHDLGDSAMKEYFSNVSPNYKLDYENITEKTGYDCAKWLVEHYYENASDDKPRFKKGIEGIVFPTVYVHSANPIGSANIMGYINNFLMNEAQPQSCVRVQISHTTK
jgi:hypothetical protein